MSIVLDLYTPTPLLQFLCMAEASNVLAVSLCRCVVCMCFVVYNAFCFAKYLLVHLQSSELLPRWLCFCVINVVLLAANNEQTAGKSTVSRMR